MLSRPAEISRVFHRAGRRVRGILAFRASLRTTRSTSLLSGNDNGHYHSVLPLASRRAAVCMEARRKPALTPPA